MPDSGDIPHHFLCPISLDIMSDPVTISTGHTFDRPSISAWLSTGNSTCPVTRSPISSDLIPNLILLRLIRHWCSFHRLSLSPTPNSGVQIPPRLAALFRQDRSVQISILFSDEPGSDELRNEALALLVTCRLTEADCHSIGSDTTRVGILIGLMREPNTIDVRAKATAFVKAVLAGTTSPSLRSRIAGADGLFDAVVAVIRDGIFFRQAVKVGVKALFELCVSKQNRKRAVVAGGAEALADVVATSLDLERGDAEGILATSELLCRTPEGCASFASSPSIASTLVRTLLKVSTSATEHAAALLLAVCGESERARREAVDAGVVTRLLLVVQSGVTMRGKRKAVALLKLLQNSWPKDFIDHSKNYCNDVVPF